MIAPAFRVLDLSLHEREVRLRLPFRFGAATLRGCPQAYVQARIGLADGTQATGMAAELMVPKWFDKRPQRSNDDNIGDLRRSLQRAAHAYTADTTPRTAWGHFAAHHAALQAAGRAADEQALVSAYGAALVDRALIDALGLALGQPFTQLVQRNALGLQPAALAPDLAGFDIDAFLARLHAAPQMTLRHTVGGIDPLTEDQVIDRPADDLPVSLHAAIGAYGLRHFKLKLGGQPDADLARLRAIAAVIAPVMQRVTLDGNEQFDGADSLQAFVDGLLSDPALQTLARCCAYIEQPLPRDRSFDVDLQRIAARMPLLMDEADGTLDAWPRAAALGYDGVSSKSCKGLYKSLINAARAARWNAERPLPAPRRWFLSAEDLTTQAGLAVQQDLALAALLGVPDAERNGHHYVNGMAALPAAEQQAWLAAHPDLYARAGTADPVRLHIAGGQVDLRSVLVARGLGSDVRPDLATSSFLGDSQP